MAEFGTAKDPRTIVGRTLDGQTVLQHLDGAKVLFTATMSPAYARHLAEELLRAATNHDNQHGKGGEG